MCLEKIQIFFSSASADILSKNSINFFDEVNTRLYHCLKKGQPFNTFGLSKSVKDSEIELSFQ